MKILIAEDHAIVRPAEPEGLIAAVRKVGGGGRWFSPGLGIEAPPTASPNRHSPGAGARS
jgi:hypothetical protein